MKKITLILSLLVVASILSACSLFSVKKLDAFSSFLHPSSGAVVEQNGKLSFTAKSDEGTADIGLLLLEAEPLTFIDTLEWLSEKGGYKGEYTHQLESGDYIIRLKLNSKPQNEYVDIKIHLIKGEKYFYTFKVLELSKSNALIDDYIFAHVDN